MSMSNFGRNPSMTQHETNNQKTLIYDLRSELSNLKNEFSRLITKPTDPTGKSKVEVKPAAKSRYSTASLDQQICTQPCSTSQINTIIRAPEGTRLEFHKTESAHFYKNTHGGFDKIGAVSKKSPTAKDCYNQQATFSKNDPIAKTVEVKNQESNGHSTPSKLKKQSQTIIYYRKNSNNVDEISDKSSTMSSKITDKSTQYLTNKSYKIYSKEDPNLNSQKIQKLQAQNQTNLSKVAALNQQVGELTQKLHQSQKDCQDLQVKNTKKQQKIWKLEQSVRQMTQKIGKANEQTLEIGRQKNKQMDIIKQGHMSELKNQHKDFENRLAVQKKNSQVKYESMIKSIRQSYQLKISEVNKQKQKLCQQFHSQLETIDKLNLNIGELKQQKNIIQLALSNTKAELNKNMETIQHLKSRQTKLQNQLKQEKSKNHNKVVVKQVICKQVGTNCEQKAEIPATTTTNTASNSSSQPNLEQQNKVLQDKLANYLNNIDKQSMKIKQQKVELDKSQKAVDESNRIICEKDILIRNLMRDCKIIEKDLIEHRRVRRELELLLEDANTSATKMQLEKLNNKYKGA